MLKAKESEKLLFGHHPLLWEWAQNPTYASIQLLSAYILHLSFRLERKPNCHSIGMVHLSNHFSFTDNLVLFLVKTRNVLMSRFHAYVATPGKYTVYLLTYTNESTQTIVTRSLQSCFLSCSQFTFDYVLLLYQMLATFED